ncbi:MAG: flagellar hook-basal body complex protein FliE [Candidatus Hydrogenedentes bacterium]|nr:flagellar hook-basal body complex protein FliE [Candidatus Hydrogenedentota bacterium]
MADPLRLAGIGIRSIGIGPTGVGAPQVEPPQPRLARPVAPPSGASFKDMLAEAIGEVQRLQTEADTTVRQLVAGEISDVTETMVAVEKADVAFQTMMLVRNKMVQAYEEIMRMQV